VIHINSSFDAAVRSLEKHCGEVLWITKKEKSVGRVSSVDVDEVQLSLEGVSVRDSGYTDEDDYVAPREVILQGRGEITSKKGKFPLPQGAYEIPVLGKVTAIEESGELKIATERALYTIRYQ